MYHKLILVGNLGKDPEMRFTQDGKAVTSFSLAASDGYGDKQHTVWFRVSVWGKQAESCNQYLRKGAKVLIEGRLMPDKETGAPRMFARQDGTTGTSYEVTADVVRFMSPKGDADPEDNEQVPF